MCTRASTYTLIHTYTRIRIGTAAGAAVQKKMNGTEKKCRSF